MVFGFPSGDYEKQQRRSEQALHEGKMKLLDGIAKHVNELKTGSLSSEDMKVKAISEMSPRQKLFLLGKLEEKIAYWSNYPAPIEQSLINQACREFEAGNYSSKVIYSYLTTEHINQALSL